MVSIARRIATLAMLIAVVSLGLAYALFKLFPQTVWVPVGLSTVSLVFSIIGTFRAEIFPFRPVMMGGDIIWIHAGPSLWDPHIALPLTIQNGGYGEGVIEWIGLRIHGPSWKKAIPYETSVDLDMGALIKAKGTLVPEAVVGQLTRLALGGKQQVAKTILFAPSLNASEGAIDWKPGTYKFEVVMKTANETPVQALSFSYTFTQANLTEYTGGKTSIFPNTGYRRELLVPEWGPQKTTN